MSDHNLAEWRNGDKIEYWSQSHGLWRGKRGMIVGCDGLFVDVLVGSVSRNTYTLDQLQQREYDAQAKEDWRTLKTPKAYKTTVYNVRKYGRRLE